MAKQAKAETIEGKAVDTVVAQLCNVTDDGVQAETLKGAFIQFAQALPRSMIGKPLPEDQVAAMTEKARVTFEGRHDVSTDKGKAIVKSLVSRIKSMATCAPILPLAYKAGFKGSRHDVLKLCTALKSNEYKVPEALKAVGEKSPERGDAVVIAMAIGAILKRKGKIKALSLGAKGELAEWASKYGISAKGMAAYLTA